MVPPIGGWTFLHPLAMETPPHRHAQKSTSSDNSVTFLFQVTVSCCVKLIIEDKHENHEWECTDSNSPPIQIPAHILTFWEKLHRWPPPPCKTLCVPLRAFIKKQWSQYKPPRPKWFVQVAAKVSNKRGYLKTLSTDFHKMERQL